MEVTGNVFVWILIGLGQKLVEGGGNFVRAIILETATVAGLLELSLRHWLGISTSSFGGFSSVIGTGVVGDSGIPFSRSRARELKGLIRLLTEDIKDGRCLRDLGVSGLDCPNVRCSWWSLSGES